MSVIVKGMEKPEACLACDFCNPFTEKPYCRRLMKVTPKTTTLPDCPLIKVPPHGRCIDADALMEKVEHDTPLSTVFEKTMRIYLKNAPTIIPADEPTQFNTSNTLDALGEDDE